MTVSQAIGRGSSAKGEVLTDNIPYVWYSKSRNTGDFDYDPKGFISPTDFANYLGIDLIISKIATFDIKDGETGEVTKGYSAVFVNNNDDVFVYADTGDQNFAGMQIGQLINGDIVVSGGNGTKPPQGEIGNALSSMFKPPQLALPGLWNNGTLDGLAPDCYLENGDWKDCVPCSDWKKCLIIGLLIIALLIIGYTILVRKI